MVDGPHRPSAQGAKKAQAQHLIGRIMSNLTPTSSSTDQIQTAIRLEGIFMPSARRRRDKLFENPSKPTRFVHYTSAEAALSIIKSKRIRMRNTNCMTDFREVQHGFDILNTFFLNEAKRNAFIQAFEECAPGSAGEAIKLFNQWLQDIRLNTYIASLSEHDDTEDLHGRLSMWRAFGGNNVARVAIIINIPAFSGGAGALNLLFSPVGYFTEADVHGELGTVIQNVHGNLEFLRSMDRTVLISYVFQMLVTGAVCLKHEGFKEEREWRAIYSPNRLPSPLMKSTTEVIGGVPQIVFNLPLDASVDGVLAELDLYRIFDRLIIGPSPYPWVMYTAFVRALTEAGIPKAAERVHTSGIPIRS